MPKPRAHPTARKSWNGEMAARFRKKRVSMPKNTREYANEQHQVKNGSCGPGWRLRWRHTWRNSHMMNVHFSPVVILLIDSTENGYVSNFFSRSRHRIATQHSIKMQWSCGHFIPNLSLWAEARSGCDVALTIGWTDWSHAGYYIIVTIDQRNRIRRCRGVRLVVCRTKIQRNHNPPCGIQMCNCAHVQFIMRARKRIARAKAPNRTFLDET